MSMNRHDLDALPSCAACGQRAVTHLPRVRPAGWCWECRGRYRAHQLSAPDVTPEAWAVATFPRAWPGTACQRPGAFVCGMLDPGCPVCAERGS